MKKLFSCLLIATLLAATQGCATLKNTKVPQAFADVGICSQCRKYVALDDLSEGEKAVCPECGVTFGVKDARLGFKKAIVSSKNKKAAQGALTITWMAATFAAAFYGIPLPPPPITEDTFSPYRTPLKIRCRKAARAPHAPLSYNDAAGCQDLYVPSTLQNPYETVRRPYSIVITDVYAKDALKPYEVSHTEVRKISHDLPDFSGNTTLGMKN